MDILSLLNKNIFSKMYFFLILSVFLIIGCEEQIDDLWETDDGVGDINPLVGDWYADSINYLDDYYYDPAEWVDLMGEKNLFEYNLWLLSDGSFQLVLNQSLLLADDCENAFEGEWNNTTGCSGSIQSYVDYSPLEYCNDWYEYNEYNIQTTQCSQNVTVEGNWTADETSNTVTISMDPLCINSESDPSYVSDSESCGSLYDGNWKTNLERTFTYDIDAATGNITLNGYWFGEDSSAVKYYLYKQ